MDINDKIIDCFDSLILKNMFIFALKSNVDKQTFAKDNISYYKDSSIYEFIVLILLKEIKTTILKKPYKNYVTIEENRYFVKGKINYKKSLKNVYNKVNCSYSLLTLDNDLNQIIKYVLYCILKDKNILTNSNLRRKVYNIYLFFEDVTLKEITIKKIDEITLNKQNGNYANLLVICKYIIGCIRSDNHVQKYIDINSLIWWIMQEFIRNYYDYHKKRLGIDYVSASIDKWDLIPLASSNAHLLPNMKTDIEIYIKDKHLVIDSKCYHQSLVKFHGKKMFHSSHLYQLKSYLDYYHIKESTNLRGILIYPYNPKTDLNVGRQIFFDKNNHYVIELVNIDFKSSWEHLCQQLDELLDDQKMTLEIKQIS